MSIYEIPNSIEELFEQGPAEYRIEDIDMSGDNVFAMELFLDSVGIDDEFITINEGTAVNLIKDGIEMRIMACGGVDFHLHNYTVSDL